jgi:hypothetical protein
LTFAAITALLLCGTIAAPGSANANANANANDDRPTDLQKIRAAFVMHFAKGTKWSETPPELRVVVVGRDDIGQILDATLKHHLLKRIIVERIARPAASDFDGAHIAIFTDSSRHDYGRFAAACRSRNVLTIAEDMDFLEAGGMVTVGLDASKRPLLRINLDAVKDSRVSIVPGLASKCEILHKGTG